MLWPSVNAYVIAVVEGWHVPYIRPLETLHNMLTLKQMTNFLKHVTTSRGASPTPNSSPTREACTPRRFSQIAGGAHQASGSKNVVCTQNSTVLMQTYMIVRVQSTCLIPVLLAPPVIVGIRTCISTIHVDSSFYGGTVYGGCVSRFSKQSGSTGIQK